MALSKENQERVDSRVNELPEDYREFVKSNFIEELAENLKTKYELPEASRITIENEVGLVILLFSPLTEFKNHIISAVNDLKTADDINQDFRQALPEGILNFIEESNKRQKFRTGEVRTTTQPKQEAEATEPEPAIEAAKPLRTMEQDAKNAHGYGVYLGETEDGEEEDEPTYKSEQENLRHGQAVTEKTDPKPPQSSLDSATDKSRPPNQSNVSS